MERGFDFDLINFPKFIHWAISAKPLPEPIARASVVQMGRSILIVGGRKILAGQEIEDMDTVYLFNPVDEEWTLLANRLSNQVVLFSKLC